MVLKELARRGHPCAPWLDLTESVKSELFPGGVGEAELATVARWQELQSRTHRLPELPEAILAGLAPSTRKAWDAVRAGAPVVLTGQQPVLAGGPFFVWLKAAGAIAAARRASKVLGREVVPLFWIAGDDSDLDEVRSQADPLSGAVLQAQFDPAGKGRPVGDLAFAADEAQRLGLEMQRLWPGTAASRIQRESRNLSEQLRRSLEHWFPDAGLAIVDAAWPGMRPAFAGSYAVFARHHEIVSQALEEGIGAARAAGLSVSLRSLPGRTRLFSLEGGVRTRLDAPENGEALAQQILADPEGFSHDAASRIFAAETAFPVLSHVLGPGEFAYVACLGRLQERLGKTIGTALPRPSLTMLPSELVPWAQACAHDLDQPAPASPRSLELEWLRRAHPETAALARFWKEQRQTYLQALGADGSASLERLLEREEAKRLRSRLLEKGRQAPEAMSGIRELWAWLGAGSLQERGVPTWALESHLGKAALVAIQDLISDSVVSGHPVLEGIR